MKKICLIILIGFSFNNFAKRVKYQGGDAFTRDRVSVDEIKRMSHFTQSTIFRTAKILNHETRSVGTGFYLYQTAEEYVFLTNYHVLGSSRECRDTKLLMLTSSYQKARLRCHKIVRVGDYDVGSDYTVFTVSKSNSSSFLDELKEIRTFSNDARVGDELSIVGFGGAKLRSSRFDIGVSNDSDCVLLWRDAQIVFNRKYDMNSIFFTGCDIRSGDSGSAVFNRRTGSLVGLLFAASYADGKLSSREIKKNLGSPYQKFFSHSSLAIDIESINLNY